MSSDNNSSVGFTKPSKPLLYVLVFTSGFTIMMVEITAPRILGPFFGSSTHVWTAVIGVVLAGLSVGYYVGGRLADRWPNASLLFGIVMGGCAITAMIPILAPLFGQWLMPPGIGLDRAHTLMKFGSLVTALFIFFPPAMLLAVVGPFTIRCIARYDRVGIGLPAQVNFSV